MPDRMSLCLNGKPVDASPECSVAACAMQAEGLALRQSVTGEPRGPLCGMGICFECRVTIDGVAHQRSCLTPCREGMQISTESSAQPGTGKQSIAPRASIDVDVLVIGAGPAGMAAAYCAAEGGKTVALVDDNLHTGGQIWRRDPGKTPVRQAAAWASQLQRSSVRFLSHTQILASIDSRTLLTESPTGTTAVHYGRLILACGAHERFLPFPGWTLPGVVGAGGLQALVKSGYSVRGQRIVVAGSGPLLLAVAEFLRSHGAQVIAVAEQAPFGNLARFAGSLAMRHPRKMMEAMSLRWQLRGVPLRTGVWPTRADGVGAITSVTLTDGASTWIEPCDALACGFGLVANLELPRLLGCGIDADFVTVDANQQTSVPGVFAVGELTGIGGLDKALVEGQIAGWAAADRPEQMRVLARNVPHLRRFVGDLERTFALRDELRGLADDATIICRCEDVAIGALKRFSNWRDAKLQTRCGMGTCQGRICGPAVQFLFGWSNDSVRPPIFPTALGNLVS